jgi:hypothetical protein
MFMLYGVVTLWKQNGEDHRISENFHSLSSITDILTILVLQIEQVGFRYTAGINGPEEEGGARQGPQATFPG